MLIDTHAHLSTPHYDKDRQEVLARGFEKGLAGYVEIGAVFGFAGNEKARELAESDARVAFTVGLHPHDARLMNDAEWARLEELALRHPKAVGIGETGLDYFYDHSPPEMQRAALVRHIDLARRAKKPLVIHDRDAHEDVFGILEAEGAFDGPGEFHCFSGDWAFARRVIDKGWMIALGGIVTFPKADELHYIARRAPLESLLIETDSPYLTPVPHRGKRNEPWMVRLVAERIAELRFMDVEALIAATGDNARRFFGLDAALGLGRAGG
ncbi:MAG: TatD family deoxyribonuclease [Myxococcales bacterium]|nr:MAG: TatD family deoxyribonuclease [Myxococcales bacterium]